MDVHVDGRVTRALVDRGIDVQRAQDDGTAAFDDAELLDRAAGLARVIVTYDDDFVSEAVSRLRAGEGFAGLVFVRPAGMGIGDMIEQLQIIAECMTIQEIANQIVYVPL